MKNIEKAELEELYYSKIKMTEITKHFGCSDVYIYGLLKKYGIPFRGHKGMKKSSISFRFGKDEVIEPYLEGESINSIAKRTRTYPLFIKKYLLENGIEVKPKSYRKGKV